MAKSWDPGICNETSGFLFNHKCDLLPRGNCSRCEKPVCHDHSHELADNPSEIFCTSCVKKSKSRRSGSREDSDFHHDDHDPYFYSAYYYGAYHYGHSSGAGAMDPHDFTEADSESLAGELDEGFESDMSAS